MPVRRDFVRTGFTEEGDVTTPCASVLFNTPLKARRDHRRMHTLAALALAVFLSCTALAHVAFPAYFRTLVPGRLPSPSIIVAASALAELVTAGLLFAPATRGAGGWVAVVLLGVFQISHLDAARHTRSATRFLDTGPGVAARLVVNAAYLAWAGAVAIASC